MTGYDSVEVMELMRMYQTIHSDHEARYCLLNEWESHSPLFPTHMYQTIHSDHEVKYCLKTA